MRTNTLKRDAFSKERKELYKKYITFFRMNPHIFIKYYFGIKLHPYQILMIWMLQRSTLAYIVASRAIGKTWLIAVWSATLAVLYPGIRIIVTAKTIKQGAIILNEKLTTLRDNHPNLAREIDNITTNANVNEATFKNGSSIRIVPSSDNSRGNRANYIIVEESRLVNKEILESVIKPFLFSRTPPYRLKPEYSDREDLKEEGLISYITSAYFKHEYWYNYVKTTIKKMVAGDITYNFLATDYLVALKHNIKTKKMIESERDDMDDITWGHEYENIPSGQSGKSYYQLSFFNRNIKRAFYPQRWDNYNQKKNPFAIEKVDGEIRIISVDIATRANKRNDNSIISCIRLIPMIGKGYQRHLVFMESHKGENTVSQAKRIKQVFFDFDADWLVLDLRNAGISVFDTMTEVTPDDERGIDYPPFTVAENPDVIDPKLEEELLGRTLGIEPRRVIFPILATAPMNAQIAVSFRNSLQKKLWHFLMSENDIEDYLIRTYKGDFMSQQSENRAFYLNPYFQTTLLVGECVNLEMNLVNGLIKVEEKDGAHKDRFTSVSYANYIISFFDAELLKQKEERNDWEAILGVSHVI